MNFLVLLALIGALSFNGISTPRAQPAPTSAPPPARTSAPIQEIEHAPKLLIYLAKGAPDACGRGCDRWIAIEGHVDDGAAARVEQFLKGLHDERLPIYLNSPGGNGPQGFAIGKMLRARKVTARVARTVADSCPGTQADDACVMIKTTRRELQASLQYRAAMCNSACGLMFFGATTRELDPEASFGVHSARINIDFKRFVTDQQRDKVLAEVRAKTGKEIRDYIAEMGLGQGLTELIASVPHEDRRFLTRDELFRFRVDPRSFGETPWTLETSGAPTLRKTAFAERGGQFGQLEWRLSCPVKGRSVLIYGREAIGAGRLTKIVMSLGGGKPQPLVRLPIGTRANVQQPSASEVWATPVALDAMPKLLELPSLGIVENRQTPDGAIREEAFDIDTAGLARDWPKFTAACARQVATPRDLGAPPAGASQPAVPRGRLSPFQSPPMPPGSASPFPPPRAFAVPKPPAPAADARPAPR